MQEGAGIYSHDVQDGVQDGVQGAQQSADGNTPGDTAKTELAGTPTDIIARGEGQVKADVKYEGEVFPLYLNVGRAINTGKYHLYDITNKIRDTADRTNGLERPKPNEGYALQNGVSDTNVAQNSTDVNAQSMQEGAGIFTEDGGNTAQGALLPPEYRPGEGTNTVNVYGELYHNGTPITVGVVATLSPGKTVISKIRTIHARRDFAKQITDKSILYLNKNKKETDRWFQTQGQPVPMSGAKYGLIRSIANIGGSVKGGDTSSTASGPSSPQGEGVGNLAMLERLFMQALDNRTLGPREGDVQGAIRYTVDNKPVVVISEDILMGVTPDQYLDVAEEIIKTRFPNGIPVSGRLVKINKLTRDEYTHSKNTRFYKSNDGTVYADKMRAAGQLDEIVLASTNYINEDLNHARKDKFVQFARGDVLMRVGNHDYSAKVVIGFTSGNNMVLYDVVDFTPATQPFAIKKETDTRSPSTQRNAKDSSNVSASNTNVAQNSTDVNTQSMQEGAGIFTEDGGNTAQGALLPPEYRPGARVEEAANTGDIRKDDGGRSRFTRFCLTLLSVDFSYGECYDTSILK